MAKLRVVVLTADRLPRDIEEIIGAHALRLAAAEDPGINWNHAGVAAATIIVFVKESVLAG
jgi:hypothetical protein